MARWFMVTRNNPPHWKRGSTRPVFFGNGEYKVSDPSFDNRPTSELLKEFGWRRERGLQIRLALLGDGGLLIPLREYFELCKTVDRGSH
jgi:hypothetical protein